VLQCAAVAADDQTRLIRPGEAGPDGRVSYAADETYALLATSELRNKVEAYLQSGALALLIDIRELAAVLAGIQGVGPEELARLSDLRRTKVGTYWGRVVLHDEVTA
jgi:predicted house-cleaning noncanonical NTP pyrophosphatase (MazG superfamily)